MLRVIMVNTGIDSLDPDQVPQNAASDQGLHCLPLIQQCMSILVISTGSKEDLYKF